MRETSRRMGRACPTWCRRAAAGTEPRENDQEVRHHLLPAGTFGEQAEQEAGDLPHPRHIGYLKKLSEKDMAGVKMMLEKVDHGRLRSLLCRKYHDDLQLKQVAAKRSFFLR